MDTANYRISTGKESMGNRGRTYRNDGVDIYEDSVQKGTWYVGHIEDGEWLQYTINVLEEGKYDLKMAVSAGDGGVLYISTGAGQDEQSVTIPATQIRDQIIVKDFPLKKGIVNLRIHDNKSGI